MNVLTSRIRLQANYLIIFKQWKCAPTVICKHREYHLNSEALNCFKSPLLVKASLRSNIHENLVLNSNRSFSKWKKSKAKDEKEESDEEDNFESQESEDMVDDYNLIAKNLASLRIDSVLKAGLGMSKKKIEKDFYVGKIRINGEKVLKKSASVNVDCELDVVLGTSPENIKMLSVDRVLIKSIGKINDAGNFPVKMQVFKKLTIENYADPWVKSSLEEED